MPVGAGTGPGPNPAAPALGGLYAPVLAAFAATVAGFGFIEPTIWKAPVQQPDIYPNLAVNAGPAPVARAPLYVNTAWRGWAQPDISPNLAARAPNTGQVALNAGGEPVFWKPKPAAPDLYPNIAIGGNAPAVQGRDPLYVNTAWRGWAQPDLLPNVAARVAVVAPRVPPAMVEPPLWRTPPAAPDLYPNLAGLTGLQPVVTGRAPLYVTAAWKGWAQPDLLPNVAVRTASQAPQRPPLLPLEPTIWAAKAAAPDIYPNVAVNGAASLIYVTATDTAQFGAPSWPQPDLWPNLAAQGVAPPLASIRPPLYVTAPWKQWPTPDLYPNIAARPSAPPVKSLTAFIEPPAWKGWPQPDLYPNVAARPSVPVVGSLTQSPEPIFWKPKQQLDQFPNLAVTPTALIYVVATDTAQLTPPKWPQPDLQPNLAISAQPPTPTPIPAPVEPWIAKRLAPQVEVFQNQAVYAASQANVAIGPSPEPVRWTPRLQLDQFPNLAIGALAPPKVTVFDPLPIPAWVTQQVVGQDWQSLTKAEQEKLRRIEKKLARLRGELVKEADKATKPSAAPPPKAAIAKVERIEAEIGALVQALTAARVRATMAAEEDDMLVLAMDEQARAADIAKLMKILADLS